MNGFGKSELFTVFNLARSCGELERKRVNRALGIVQGGKWEETEDGLLVQGSRRRPYRVNGACTCQDYHRHGWGWWCKHRIARALIVRAREEAR